ncbi:hypothetical protein EC968_009965 [Mortierella alpina]|nr:hypothetical protein EC968_009965 [Mortierella alpina]
MAIKKKVQFKNDDADLVSVSLNGMESLPFHNVDLEDGPEYKDSKASSMLDKNQVDPEPVDSNSMEPSPSSIPAPVAQPPPLHCNTSPHRHSSTPTTMGDPTSVLTDKTHQHLSTSSCSTTTTTTTTAPPLSSSVSVDSASSLPKNATTTVEFVLESPDLHAIEMQHFGTRSSNDKNLPTTVLEEDHPHHHHHHHPSVSQVSPPLKSHSEQPPPPPTAWQSNFFTGWFTIPPSLAGRPRLTQQQEEFVKREFERGPVPLMWPKEADLENQSQDWRNDITHGPRRMKNGQEGASSVSGGWFRSWGFGNTPSKRVEMRTEGAMA